jgi:hypothetical protein
MRRGTCFLVGRRKISGSWQERNVDGANFYFCRRPTRKNLGFGNVNVAIKVIFALASNGVTILPL